METLSLKKVGKYRALKAEGENDKLITKNINHHYLNIMDSGKIV